MNVSKFIEENVPKHLIHEFKKKMVRWDGSLRNLPIAYYPSYDEDVLWTILEYTKADY